MPSETRTARAFRLGKLRRPITTVAPRLRAYLSPSLPAPPASADWYSKVPASALNIDGNDQYGDCVFAAWGHTVETMTYNADPSSPVNPTPAQVVADYLQYTGGQDTGAVISQVLADWVAPGWATGVPSDATDVLTAYAELSVGNFTELQQAIALFGNAIIGVVLPDYILDQPLGQPWDVPSGGSPPAPDPNNGHCVPLLGYDGTYYYCVTWGVVTPITPAFLAASGYWDEGWVACSRDWVEAQGTAPSGIDWAQLQADLAAIAQGPPPAPQPAPPQPPTSCSTILDAAEEAFATGHVLSGVEGLFDYLECVLTAGKAVSRERRAVFVERVRRGL